MFIHTGKLLVAFCVSKGLEQPGFEPVIYCTVVQRANHSARVPARYVVILAMVFLGKLKDNKTLLDHETFETSL